MLLCPMAGFTSVPGVALFLLVWTSSVVGTDEALEKIPAKLGEDVTLPCKVPNNIKINIIAVEWIRRDLHPDYVLLYRDGRIDLENQNPSYQNRVDLQDKEMKDGDFSMILKNVKMEDNGTYECRVFQGQEIEPINNITLVVLPSVQTNITAEVGQNKVTLPCKVPNNIHITSVVWRRPDLHPEYVLLYRSGCLDPDNQNPSYQNRVDMQDKEMKDGNFSMILKNVKKNDSGIYECLFFEKGKKYHISSNINLEVHLSGDKVEGGKSGIIRDEGNKIGKDISRGRPGAVVSVILLLVVLASVGFLIFRRHKKKS